MKLCWAEKAALIWAIVPFGALLLMKQHSASLFDDAAFELYWIVFSRTVLPVWIILRLIDLALGGPARRKGKWRIYLD